MILHLLRHVSLCLWMALFITGLVSFWMLPVLQPLLGADAAPLLAAGLLAAVLAAVARAANRLGQGRVQRLLRRADRAEREGLNLEAEKAFQNALGALDSFLLSPSTRRRALLPLAGRLARCYLSETHFSPSAEDFIVRYLGANPQDQEVAEQWLVHVGRQGGLRDEHQDLAGRLAETYPRHPVIQREVARLYLALERTDYPALQTYRRVCAEDGRVPPEFCIDLARLFQKDGRSDEWAQQALRQARAAAPAPAPAGSRPEKPPEPARPAEIETELPDEDEGAVFRMAAKAEAFDGDEDEEEERTPLRTRFRRGPLRLERMIRRGADALAAVRGRLHPLDALRNDALRGIWRQSGVRKALAVLLIAGVAAGGVWVALNPAGPLAPSSAEAPTVDSSVTPAASPEDRFALQVAAYLKQDYALKRVEELKSKGLDAYWVQTASSGKTWYQVRIASFPDQQSAREFGRHLKSKGVIDDFYVTSAVR